MWSNEPVSRDHGLVAEYSAHEANILNAHFLFCEHNHAFLADMAASGEISWHTPNLLSDYEPGQEERSLLSLTGAQCVSGLCTFNTSTCKTILRSTCTGTQYHARNCMLYIGRFPETFPPKPPAPCNCDISFINERTIKIWQRKVTTPSPKSLLLSCAKEFIRVSEEEPAPDTVLPYKIQLISLSGDILTFALFQGAPPSPRI